MNIQKRLTQEEAIAFLRTVENYARQHSQRFGQALMNLLEPYFLNPEIFYGSEEYATYWFYQTMVEQGSISMEDRVELCKLFLQDPDEKVMIDYEDLAPGKCFLHSFYTIGDSWDCLDKEPRWEPVRFSIYRKLSQDSCLRIHGFNHQDSIGEVCNFAELIQPFCARNVFWMD